MALCGFKSKANDDLWARRGSGRNIWERLEWAEFCSMTTPGLFGVRSTEGRCYWASVCQVLKNLQRGKKKLWLVFFHSSSWLPFFLSILVWRAKDQGSLLINHLESFHPSWKSNTPLMEYWDIVAEQTNQVHYHSLTSTQQICFQKDKEQTRSCGFFLQASENSASTSRALY